MKGAYRMTKAVMILFVAMTMLLVASAAAWSQAQTSSETAEGTSAEINQYVKGKVKKISHAAGTMVVKPNKGAAVHLILTNQTTFVGFSSIEEISPKQPVEVWYFPQGDSNMAVKIEKLPELGC